MDHTVSKTGAFELAGLMDFSENTFLELQTLKNRNQPNRFPHFISDSDMESLKTLFTTRLYRRKANLHRNV